MGVMNTAVQAMAVGVGIYFLKQFMNGGVCTSDVRIDGKVVVVTGANTGIGKEATADLALRGGKIYLACRSMERGQAAVADILETHPSLSKKSLIVTKLDLASMESIRSFAAGFKKKERKLDILINNAGVMMVPHGTVTEDGFEATFGVNHLGHFLLTNLLMDEIVSAAPSRVVTVSSDGHKRGSGTIDLDDPMLTSSWTRLGSYAQSKLANVIFSRELGKRLAGTGVTTYSLHPGVVDTELTRHIPVIGHPFVLTLLKPAFWVFMKDSRAGAQTQICCAVDDKLKGDTGKYYADCMEAKPEVEAATDDELSTKLWDLSMKLVNLEEKDIHPKLRK